MNEIKAETELFPLDLKLEQFVDSLRIYEYKVRAESNVIEFFGGENTITYNLVQQVNGFYQSSSQGSMVCTLQPLKENQLCFNFGKEMIVDLVSISENRKLDLINDRSLIFKILYRELRKSIEKSGFKIKGSSAYSTLDELTKDLFDENEVSNFGKLIGLYGGFSFRLHELNGILFLQVSPKSTFEFKTDIYDLLKSDEYSENSLEDLCQRIRLSLGKTVDLRSILEKKCSEPIQESPFNGKSLMEYNELVGDFTLKKPDANLLLVFSEASNSLHYASSEGSKPVIDFESIANLEPDAYSKLNKKLKSQSAKRKDLALQFVKSLELVINGKPIKIRSRHTYAGSLDEKIDLNSPFDDKKFFKFSDPVVLFRDKNGNPKPASRETNDTAAPQDILKRGYLPYQVPKEINITLLAIKGLEDSAEKLKEAILFPSNFVINLQEKLGCKFNIGKIITIDPENNFPTINADCALVIGHKKNQELPFFEIGEYTDSEVSILEQGIPAQYVIHAPHNNLLLDHSVESKIKNPNALLGIGVSIIAKIGGNSMVLSPYSTKDFPHESVIIGYNMARVFEPIDSSVKKSENPIQLTKTSIALSACVTMIDKSGSEMIHQAPHEVPDENSLFRGERAQKLFEQIPDDSFSIIIHKDGPFHKQELNDLKSLRKKGLKIYPVSIITNNVPRITTTLQSSYYLPKPGMCVPLSSNEFLLSTTLIQNEYNPVNRGWPNPLNIRIHQIEDEEIKTPLKSRILNQIWTLTRCDPVSQIPTRRPMSIHYSNKIAKFIRKAKKAKPLYFKKFANQKNRFGWYPKPFI